MKPALFALFWTVLRLGAVAFGGLGAALALIQRELVERRGWVDAADVKNALAFTKPLPGSTVVQVVAFLGWRMRRWPGALVATAAFLLPSMALMIAAAAGAAALPDAAWVRGLFSGIAIAVVGLLAAALWKLAQAEIGDPLLIAVMGIALVSGFFVDAALIVLGFGFVGAFVVRRRKSHA
jgi:chromate transporter